MVCGCVVGRIVSSGRNRKRGKVKRRNEESKPRSSTAGTTDYSIPVPTRLTYYNVTIKLPSDAPVASTAPPRLTASLPLRTASGPHRSRVLDEQTLAHKRVERASDLVAAK